MGTQTQLQPLATSVNDICQAALLECGALGQGQQPTGDDIADAWARLQWMLQEWGEQRMLCYRVNELTVQSVNVSLLPTDSNLGTASSPVYYFPVGPGAGASGGFETGANIPASGSTPEQAISVRPQSITSCFLRQPSTGNGALPIDYPLFMCDAMEDYMRIALKSMVSFPGAYFYDPRYPLGALFLYPLPTNAIYGVGISFRQQLPIQFVTVSDVIELPPIYFPALVYNLALRLRPSKGLRGGPGDELPNMAKAAREAVKSSEVQIPQLSLPQELSRPGIYNIFSDRTY